MTLRALIDTLEGKSPSNPAVAKMLRETSGRRWRRAGAQTIADEFPADDATSPYANILGWPGATTPKSSSILTAPSFRTR